MTYAVDYALVDGNAPPDFAAARAAGAGIVGIRGSWGYRGTTSMDPTLQRDTHAVRAAGCQLFGYVFLDYQTPFQPQCDALAKGYIRITGDLPVMLDLEVDQIPAGVTPQKMLLEAEMALDWLQRLYGQNGVWVYTSLEQWQDHFADQDSALLGSVPLCLKTPYPWRARNPPKLSDFGPMTALPRPWVRPGSPGAWLRQFQGDAIGFPGFSSTVDISTFLAASDAIDFRWPWIQQRSLALCGSTDLAIFQTSRGLTPDRICGPRTFAALCQG